MKKIKCILLIIGVVFFTSCASSYKCPAYSSNYQLKKITYNERKNGPNALCAKDKPYYIKKNRRVKPF